MAPPTWQVASRRTRFGAKLSRRSSEAQVALSRISALAERSGHFPRDGAAPLLAGYQLLEELGGGKHYVVQRARSPADARDVVIKRLRDTAAVGSVRARLLRAARVGMGLSAPNLVRVRALHDSDELFVVMEHVEGATLEHLLTRSEGASALRCVLPAFVDTLSALAALHHWKSEEGVPSFLVHQAPSLRHMLVGTDGVARLLDLTHAHGPLLAAGVPYASGADGSHAPEQFDAPDKLDPRCDIFLVGAALEEALTTLERAGGHASGARCAAHWSALHAVAERALSPKPSARFWSAEEMGFALRSVAEEAGVYASREEMAAWVRGTHVTRDAARSAFGLVRSPTALPRLAAEAVHSAARVEVLPPLPPLRDHSLTWPDEQTTIWLRADDGDSLQQQRSHTTLVYERQRVFVAEPPLFLRDAPPSKARRITCQVALGALAATALLVLGLRSAAAPQRAAAARADVVATAVPATQSKADALPPSSAPQPTAARSVRPRLSKAALSSAGEGSVGDARASEESPTQTAPKAPDELPENPY
jgi:hypothetical protein